MEIFFLLHILMNEYKDMPASQYGGGEVFIVNMRVRVSTARGNWSGSE